MSSGVNRLDVGIAIPNIRNANDTLFDTILEMGHTDLVGST